jgi:hypothetical protein
MRFAPISAAPSAPFRFAVWIFAANAVLGAIGLVLGLGVLGFELDRLRAASIAPLLVNTGLAVAWITLNAWIVRGLLARRTDAYVAAVAVLLLQTVSQGWSFATHKFSFAFSAICLIAMASVWGEIRGLERRMGGPRGR